ncbi:hypothetical protein ACOZ38_25465 [Sphaerisporangium viridialbum]|uniref:hypothetical protein n=1 Tax=Sphaerisporangium viridialbum TaxID=46189 RepID=UPI003C748642
MRDVLTVIGAVSALITVGILVYAWRWHCADVRRKRAGRDVRARRPVDQVVTDKGKWGDFWVDHDLHKLNTSKEEKA